MGEIVRQTVELLPLVAGFAFPFSDFWHIFGL